MASIARRRRRGRNRHAAPPTPSKGPGIAEAEAAASAAGASLGQKSREKKWEVVRKPPSRSAVQDPSLLTSENPPEIHEIGRRRRSTPRFEPLRRLTAPR